MRAGEIRTERTRADHGSRFVYTARLLVLCNHEDMSVTPNETAGAAREEAPQTAPTAMDSRGLSLTIVAFVVFLVTWIGAKAAVLAAPNGVGGTTDVELLQLVLLVIAGAAAVGVGRSLRSVPRSIFVVITVFYFVFAALGSVFAGASDGLDVDVPFIAVISAVVAIADLVYPLVIAQVLAVTVSRVTPLAAGAEADRLGARTRRRGKSAATFLFIAAAATIAAWLVRTVPLYLPPQWQTADWATAAALWEWGDAVNAVAAAVGSVAAVFALRAVAESRALSSPEPIVGAGPKQARPVLAHTLAFLTVAAGLWFCMTSTAISIDFGAALSGGYPAWALSLIVFTLGSIVLAIVTLDAVTRRLSARTADSSADS